MAETGKQSTKERLVAESMRLFGSRGYAGTSISDIEAAAGLSAGSGSLYRHFSSKEDLLAAGIRRQIADGRSLLAFLGDPQTLPRLSLRERLTAVATAGLRRLEQEADFNRILVRDLKHFPELLAIAKDDEVARIHTAVATWLSTQSDGQRITQEWDALAAVIIGSISNFWLLVDVFGRHPAGISEDRYIAALVDMLVPSIEGMPES
ncbi:helix-turn-helix domain-containing protein [Saxibacter everestensis]|uniref:Helix-turn-helix domain-containing protein n=1 Tax=Saxibacter everestensis TaxID=2909229 RepID=A0ABY8QZM9_9MICO|nr:helix-turn-helix domain-containing protein [Brevibacteriaceae bacterium ZFBP1038]